MHHHNLFSLLVYTLWRHPQLIPLLHTPDFVLQKLKGGADLMTPGLARGPPFPSKAVINSLVAVASIERPSVPRFVGVCEIDIASTQQVQGAKGHAVKGYHWEGDEIWAWSQGGSTGENAPEEVQGWDQDKGTEDINEEMQNLTVDDTEADADNGGILLDDAANIRGAEFSHNEFVEGEDPSANESQAAEKELSTKGAYSLLNFV